MASLCNDPNGHRRILFVDGHGDRHTIRLGKTPKKMAESFLANVEALLAARTLNTSLTSELIAWLRNLPDTAYGRLAAVGLVDPRIHREPVTLGKLIQTFVDRATVKPSTRKAYKQTTDSLLAVIGGATTLDAITPEQADVWKKSITDDGLSPATVAKRVYVARSLFRKAVKWKMVGENPFVDVEAGSQRNPDRAFYVSPDVITAVLHHCPDPFWRTVVGLGRYAALRTPSEPALLTWADVDWAEGRLTVRSPKTARHEGHAVRAVPICPQLRVILEEAFAAAPDGQKLVVPRILDPRTNLRTTLTKIVERAGFEPWPRLFQNLRASCATDWVQRYPNHEVARWLGHSPLIAATHYLQARDHHFRDVVQGGAHSGAPEAQIPAQQPPAVARQDSQEAAQVAQGQTLVRDPANPRDPSRGKGMGDIGLEPMTPSLSSWCSNQLS
jgi:integrase